MNINDKYFIPEKIEDIYLRYVSIKVKEVLTGSAILQDILQKHIVAYNKTLKQRGSAKSLEVMKQNYNLVFSTIAISGVKKSPRCSRFNLTKDVDVPSIINHQHRTPLKTNRISSSTERKRLSFDVAENECTKPVQAFTEGFNTGQMHFGTSATFFKSDDEANLYDGSEEISYLDGIPQYVATSSFHDKAALNLTIKSPDKDEFIVISPEKKNRTQENFLNKEKPNPWYLECRPSFYRLEILPKASDSPDKYIQERFNLEGKPETITKLAISDRDNTDLSSKTPDKHQTMITSPEEKKSTRVNLAIKGKKSARSMASKKADEVFDKNKTNERKSFCHAENENVSSLTVDYQKISCTSYKTPEKLQTFSGNANREEIRTKKQIAVKRVTVKTASNEKGNLSPMKDDKTSHDIRFKKRKFVDNLEEFEMFTSQVTHHQECTTPSKLSKIKKSPTTNEAKCTISADTSVVKGNDSICSTSESPLRTKTSCSSSVENYDSANRAGDNFIVHQDVTQSHGKSKISDFPINNNSDIMVISPAKISKSPEYKASIRLGNDSHFSPEADQKKMAVEILPHISNSKNDENKMTAEVDSLTNLMKNLSPSVKRSFDGDFQKSEINRSVGDATLEAKLCLQDKLLKTATRTKECFISNNPSPKTDDSFAIQVEKFTEILKQRRSRFSIYLHLFADDRHDLKLICAYIMMLDTVLEEIPINDNNQVLIETVNSFVNIIFKLRYKAHLWKTNIVQDLDVWEDCIQKINQMEQDIKRLCGEKYMNPKDFQKIEESFRIVNKKADDMILLREIRRPTNIQFVYELKNVMQLFIQIMIQVGLLKHSSDERASQ